MEQRLLRSSELQGQTFRMCGEAVLAAADAIAYSFRNDGKLLLCGNGGSAADCQHVAAELMSRLSARCHRRGLPALALTTDTSFLTAFSNDFAFEGIFARQIESLGKPGDVLIAISTSGNSPNVLAAIDAAKCAAMVTIGLSGSTGQLRSRTDIAVAVPSEDTQFIQEMHLAIEHLICTLVETELFPLQ